MCTIIKNRQRQQQEIHRLNPPYVALALKFSTTG
ncbi:hypothetical protein L915_03284 [Phytophthora nicotianae]|uniref:Uncharacterized protein n=1 Tax=Phytophthora nicotianae TaxID=4792 RepID=W2HEA2_PHYNI|nr:hypothetical protein L915_03284 [Phytophthora nicotianae]ETM53247.1 hypothetical protein L914_03263 [Phytophthora nicotianae]